MAMEEQGDLHDEIQKAQEWARPVPCGNGE